MKGRIFGHFQYRPGVSWLLSLPQSMLFVKHNEFSCLNVSFVVFLPSFCIAHCKMTISIQNTWTLKWQAEGEVSFQINANDMIIFIWLKKKAYVKDALLSDKPSYRLSKPTSVMNTEKKSGDPIYTTQYFGNEQMKWLLHCTVITSTWLGLWIMLSQALLFPKL